MTTTVPIQAALAPHSASRAGKPSSNASATPFNALLSQEMAQRHTETAPAIDKTAKPATPQQEHEVNADDRNQSEEHACELINATGATDLLTLVAGIAQLTVEAPADATATVIGANLATLPGKTVSFDAGRHDLDEKATVLITDRTALAADNANEVSGSTTTSGTADFASTILHSASPSSATGFPSAFVRDTATVLAPASPETVVPMQQTMTSFAVQDIAPATNRLTPLVGTPAWDHALGNKIIWIAGSDMQTASLTLNPPELGPLQVVLNVSNNQASATFSAAQPEVRQALEAAMPKLREMMSEAGIALGQATVDAGASSRQEMADQRSYAHRSNDSRRMSTVDAPDASVKRPVVTTKKGLVDTFA